MRKLWGSYRHGWDITRSTLMTFKTAMGLWVIMKHEMVHRRSWERAAQRNTLIVKEGVQSIGFPSFACYYNKTWLLWMDGAFFFYAHGTAGGKLGCFTNWNGDSLSRMEDFSDLCPGGLWVGVINLHIGRGGWCDPLEWMDGGWGVLKLHFPSIVCVSEPFLYGSVMMRGCFVVEDKYGINRW